MRKNMGPIGRLVKVVALTRPRAAGILGLIAWLQSHHLLAGNRFAPLTERQVSDVLSRKIGCADGGKYSRAYVTEVATPAVNRFRLYTYDLTQPRNLEYQLKSLHQELATDLPWDMRGRYRVGEVGPRGPHGNGRWEIPSNDLRRFMEENPLLKLSVLGESEGLTTLEIRYSDPNDIQRQMDELFEMIRKGPRTWQPSQEHIEVVYKQYIHTHPFANANGRVGDVLKECLEEAYQPGGRLWRRQLIRVGTRVATSAGVGLVGDVAGSHVTREMGYSEPVANNAGSFLGSELATGIAFGFSGPQVVFSGAIAVLLHQASENHEWDGSRTSEMRRGVEAVISNRPLPHELDWNSRPPTWADTFHSWTPWFFGGGWGE